MHGRRGARGAQAPSDAALQPFHAPLPLQILAPAKLSLSAGLRLDGCSSWKGDMGTAVISLSLLRSSCGGVFHAIAC